MEQILSDILFIDIETVSSKKKFKDLPPIQQKHWIKKVEYLHSLEERTPEQLFPERGGIYAEFGKIIVISIGIIVTAGGKPEKARLKTFYSANEKDLLEDFRAFVETKFDQKKLKLCAHNGKEFDFPFIIRRLLINGINIPQSLQLGNKKPWEINHLDTMNMWKFGDRKNFTALELLCSLFDIPSSKDTMDGSMVGHVFYHDPEGLEKIANYCTQDVIATIQLYLRLNNMPIINQENILIK